jgi:hypothetical protein
MRELIEFPVYAKPVKVRSAAKLVSDLTTREQVRPSIGAIEPDDVTARSSSIQMP